MNLSALRGLGRIVTVLSLFTICSVISASALKNEPDTDRQEKLLNDVDEVLWQARRAGCTFVDELPSIPGRIEDIEITLDDLVEAFFAEKAGGKREAEMPKWPNRLVDGFFTEETGEKHETGAPRWLDDPLRIASSNLRRCEQLFLIHQSFVMGNLASVPVRLVTSAKDAVIFLSHNGPSKVSCEVPSVNEIEGRYDWLAYELIFLHCREFEQSDDFCGGMYTESGRYIRVKSAPYDRSHFENCVTNALFGFFGVKKYYMNLEMSSDTPADNLYFLLDIFYDSRLRGISNESEFRKIAKTVVMDRMDQ